MAYKTPSIPVVPNPVFIDKAIQEIQNLLGALNWLTYSFGRSYNKVEFANGSRTKVPMVYKGNSEYLPVQFNDNLQAQSFFVVGSQEIEGDYDEHTTNFYSVPTQIIVWANLKKIDSAKGNTYYFAEELKQELRQVLRNSNLLYSDIGAPKIDENIDSIFAFSFNVDLIVPELC